MRAHGSHPDRSRRARGRHRPAPRGLPRAVLAPLLLALPLALALALAPQGSLSAQSLAPWTLTRLTEPGDGIKGARQPDIGAEGEVIAFRHDGTGTDPGDNPDRDTEVFAWVEGSGLTVLRRIDGNGADRLESRPSVSRDGRRIAFASNAELDGGAGPPANPDGSTEAMVLLDLGDPPPNRRFTQLSAGPSGSAAESPALSSDGRVLTFWHDADLTGDNPDGSLELFRAELGGRLDQLTDLSGSPYHSLPDISADGSRITFVLEADLTGANPDASWELFSWTGPPSSPGDPARFTQLTDWRPPMTGREIHDPSISDDGRRVAFAGRGHVDRSQPGPHVPLEIYLWDEGAGLRRLTTATSGRASSLSPRIAADGRRIAFLSLSDFAGQNANGNLELFVWSEPTGIEQVTDTTGRPNISALVPELVPGLDGTGHRAAYLSEKADDPAPLVLTSRLGILFRADDPRPAAPTPSPSPPGPPATPEPAGSVCPLLPGRVPPAVIAAALADPASVEGWLRPANPALPPSWTNPLRTWLALRDWGKPYGPFNPVLWKAGCP